MSDLISRQDALNYKTKITDLPGDTTMEEARGWSAGVRMYQKYIKNLPPAQPEIIHCNECRHRFTHNCVANTWVSVFGYTVDDNFYCGLAERSTDG